MEQIAKPKRIFSTAIVIALLAILAGAGIIFGYLSQSVAQDFEIVIRSTNVTFKYNGQTYLDEIKNDSVSIYKGAKTDIVMTVEVVGSRKAVVEYKVEFVVEKRGAEADALMSAVEVYRRHGAADDESARREYIGQLNQIEDFSFGGVMVTEHYEEIPLEFVFSSAAKDDYNEYYDYITGGEAVFSVKAYASANVTRESERFVFASTSAEFEEMFTAESTAGRTIILVGTDTAENYIQLNSNLTSAGAVGIDLNGRALRLNNYNLNIGFSGFAPDSVDAGYPNYGRLGITDSKGSGSVVGSGYVSVKNLSGAFLIDGRLDVNLNTASGKIRFEQASYGEIFYDYLALLNKRAERLNDGTVYKDGDDVSFLFDNLGVYYETGLFPISETDSSTSAIVYDGTAKTFSIANSSAVTSKYWYGFLFSYAGSLFETFSGYVSVRGNSVKAIADDLIKELSLPISSSQFLRTYDSVTGAHIEWSVDDGMNGRLFDSNGIYRKNGFDDIIGELGAGYPDKNVKIYVKVTKGADGGGNYADEGEDTGLFAYTHQVVTVTAKERTALIFNNTPIVLAADELFDVRNDYLNHFLGTETDAAEYVGLTGIKIKIVEDKNKFLKVNSVDNEETDVDESIFNTLCVNDEVTVPQNTLTNVVIDITFQYEIGAETREYTITKQLTVEGEFSEVTKYDMSYTLQIAFTSNEYTEGTSNTFYAYGALRPLVNGESVAVLADYTAQGTPAQYLSIRYDFIPVSALGGVINEQLAYFVKNGNGEFEYIDEPTQANIDENNLYERKAVIEVLYSRITTVDEIIAYLSVSMYTLKADGSYTDLSGHRIKGTPNYGYINEKNSLVECEKDEYPDSFKIYKDPTVGSLRRLNYNVSLLIIGIIRNSSAHVADLRLYDAYRRIFDANNDGIITNKEAENWAGVKERHVALKTQTGTGLPFIKEYTSLLGGTVYYIDLTGLPITSLKGVEYFKGVEGYSFAGTGRINLAALSPLLNLRYLDLSSNLITDLSSLQFLDRLEYLNLFNNRITNIEPLRYLSSLAELNLSSSAATGYNVISSYEPLTIMTNLRILDLSGVRTTNGTGLHADGSTMYYFALIDINNPGINFIYDFDIEIDDSMRVAARVMRDLENINRVSSTLYLPTYYYYKTGDSVVKYQLYWYVDKEENNLKLYYDDDDPIENPVVKYTIASPIQDKPIRIFLKVYKVLGSAESYDISREFRLTLEASYVSEDALIYDYITGSPTYGRYIPAAAAIPDAQLRTRLFELFNNRLEGTVTGVDASGNPIVTNELYVISKEDLDWAYNNSSNYHNLSYQGISDLTGLSYFFRALRGQLDLSGNPFESEELQKLTNLSNTNSLILGGNKYNFEHLLNSSGALILSFNATNTSRLTIYVAECFGLDDYEVLRSLYKVYLSKNFVDIYIGEVNSVGTPIVWDPYAKTLPEAISMLKTTAAFAKVGDVFDAYAANGGVTGIPFEIYGVSYNLLINAGTLYYLAGSTTQTITTTATTYFNYSSGKLTYKNSFDGDMSVTARFPTQFSETRGVTNVTKLFNYYYLQLIVVDGGDYIDVYEDGDTGRYLGTLSEVLAVYELKPAVYTRLYNYIGTNWGSAALKVTDRGLLSGTANAGRFSIDSGYTGTFADYKGRIAVSTLIFNTAYSTVMSGLESGLTIALYNNKAPSNSSIAKQGSLAGLQYFPTITDLAIYADVDFGNGAGLKNIRTLNLFRMAVDFSRVSEYAYNLTAITMTFFYFFDAGKGADSAFQYFPNLQTLNVVSSSILPSISGTSIYSYWINDFSFLLGLIDGGGKSSLTFLNIYGYSGPLPGTTTTASNMPTSDENAEAVKAVYVAALSNGSPASSMSYQIGSPVLQTNTGYFHAVYGGAGAIDYGDLEMWQARYYNVQWLSDADFLDSFAESWGAGVSKSSYLNVDDATHFSAITAYSYMQDMGLSYDEKLEGVSKRVYWQDDEKRMGAASTVTWTDKDGVTQTSVEGLTTLAAGTEIYLPASTAAVFYGLKFGSSTELAREYYIRWDVFVVFDNGIETVEHRLNYNGFTGAVSQGVGYSLPHIIMPELPDAGYDDCLKITFSGSFANSYVAVIGTLITAGSEYTDEENEILAKAITPYSYWYELKIGKGDGVYTYNSDKNTGLRDMAVRMWLFANRNIQPNASGKYTIDLMTTNSYYEIRRYPLYATMGYTNYLPTEGTYSLYDQVKSLYGICDVFDYWGITLNITSFILRNGKFKDISPLYRLENLELLNLQGSNVSVTSYYRSNVILDESISTYINMSAGLAGRAGAFLNLTTLNLTNCLSVVPDSVMQNLDGSTTRVGLRYFALTTRTLLNTLNLSGTRCMYSYESVEFIRDIIDATDAESIILTLNYTAAQAVSLGTVNDFLLVANLKNADNTNKYPLGITTESTLYTSGAESFTSPFAYSYNISADTLYLMKNSLIAQALDIRLAIITTATGYRQFTNTYTPDNAISFTNVAVTSDWRFSADGSLTAKHFDTEVLSYLFARGLLTQNGSGYYVYQSTANTTLSSVNTATISPIRGLFKVVGGVVINANEKLKGSVGAGNILLDTTYNVSIYALSYKESLIAEITGAYSSIPNTSYTLLSNIYTTLLQYVVAPGASASITYVTGSQPEYIAELPSIVYSKGVACTIDWLIGYPNNLTGNLNYGQFRDKQGVNQTITRNPVLTLGVGDASNPTINTDHQEAYKLLYTDGNTGRIYLILNPKTLPANEMGEFTDFFHLSYNLVDPGGTIRRASKSITLTSRGANVTSDNSKYIEAVIDTDNYIKLIKADGTPYYTVGHKDEISYEALYKTSSETASETVNEKYYTYQASDTMSVTVMINANYLFESPWFVEYLYAVYFNTIISELNGAQYGYIMTPKDIKNLTSIDVRYGAGTSSNANYQRNVTSIEGVQVFYNLNSFIARTGRFTDISPLQNLALKTFYYSPISDYKDTGVVANVQSAPQVYDFSPLLGASKNTLEYFSYNGGGMVQMTDMNFLLGLTALKEVYIASSHITNYYLTTSGTQHFNSSSNALYYNALSYFMTAQGRYVLSALAAKDVYVFTRDGGLTTTALYYANTNLQGSGRSSLTTVNITREANDPNNIAGYSVVYALKASINEGYSYDVLSSFSQINNQNDVSYLDGVTYKDNFIIQIDSAKAAVGTQSYAGRGDVVTSVTFDIATIIVHNGGFYVIDWESSGANTVINKYYLTNNITIDGVTYYKDTALSVSDLSIIANSIEYYNEYRAGLNQLKTSVTVLLNDNLHTVTNARVSATINMGDYGYSRMFTLSFV